ncbi:MAG: CPBP family intramembrane metalloprotease [Gammaproteobacteria bacterium]|nr:CPBP family intramembrane metalloprotease [Gammaproteobacteria bacterium]
MNEFIPFIFLSLIFPLLWWRDHHRVWLRYAWLIALLVALAGGVYNGNILYPGLVVIVTVGLLAWSAGCARLPMLLRWISGAGFIVCALVLGLHRMPGFVPQVIMQNVLFTATAQAYTLSLHFDKTLVGVFILGWWYPRPLWHTSWRATVITLLRSLPVVIASVVLVSVLLGYVRFEPKLVPGLGRWIWVNLLLTCTAEEAFFRGLIQRLLMLGWSHRPLGKWMATAIAAILFGLAHAGGGGGYVLLAVTAGFGYGTVYTLTGRIEASIVCHFSVNLIHILLFTYPALTFVGRG